MRTIEHSPYVPYDEAVVQYAVPYGHLSPWEYGGWKTESLSWKETCYLHGGLNPPWPYRLSGPGALDLLQDACINGFQKFSIGCSKHAVMCNDRGNVMTDGIVMRTGEDEFVCYSLNPYIDYLVASGRYDVTGEDLTGKVFLFQIAGPRSLEVVEAATRERLRDLEFLWHREAEIVTDDGVSRPVRVFRLGVARTLAYEVHGRFEDAKAIFRALQAAGQPFGIERLGMQVYGMNHTEGGFAQSFIHFLPAYTEDESFMEFLDGSMDGVLAKLPGSAGPDVTRRYANPVELGWGHMIRNDRDFTGKAALEAAMAEPRRRIVTLEWDEADVLSVYASQFNADQDADFMDFAANPIWEAGNSVVFTDDVLIGNTSVGVSSGRIFSVFYRRMLSLGLIDLDLAHEGQEVEVLWGRPGTHQMRIRARVARYPYLDLPKNAEIDVRHLS